MSRLVGVAAAIACAVLVAAPASAVTSAPSTPTPAPPTTGPATGAVVGGDRLAAGGNLTDLPAGVPAPPKMPALSYVVADLATGEVIAARSAHAPHLPASTLKALTALTVLPGLDQRAQVLVEPGDVVDGSKVGISPGSHYTVEQLLQGMMLASGNDAATAVARAAGGVQLTVARMQAEALALGAHDTVVRNPSGLDAQGQVTSAYDLALVARAGMKVPAFRELVATRHINFPGKQVKGKRRTTYQIQNHNRLLANYDGANGVKNGYTVAARWSVIGAATRGGRSYVVTALGCSSGSWRPTAALLDWAFAHGAQAEPVGRLVEPGEVTTIDPTSTATGAAAQAELRADAGAKQDGDGTSTRSLVTVVALVSAAGAALLLTLAGLSARARRSQLRAARVARSGRRPRR